MFSIENVVTLFSISGVVTFSSPDPKCSHVFKGYARFHQELWYALIEALILRVIYRVNLNYETTRKLEPFLFR